MNVSKRFAAVAAVLASVFSTTAGAAMQWETGKYTPASWTPAEGNVILNNAGTWKGTNHGEGCANKVSLFTDAEVPGATWDKSKIFGVQSGSVYWTFTNGLGVVEAKDLTAVNIFTRWGDGGRDGIAISKIEVKYAGDDATWVDIGAPAVSYGVGNNGSGGALYATLSNGGAALALSATAIRLTFGGQDNNGTGYVEIEVIGEEHSDDNFAVLSSIPASYGTPTPAYGAHKKMAKGATTLTMADSIYLKTDSGDVYSCTGWSYEDADGNVTHGDGTTAEIDYTGGICFFTWNWEVIGHDLVVSPISAALGTITVTPPTYGEHGYDDGSVVTVSVAPAGDNVFACWVGDVPAGHETDNPLSITVEAAGSIAPSFCWQYDASARTISDGDWVLNVSGNRESLTIAGNKSHAIGSLLDLDKPIVGGGAITAVNQQVFANATYIKELRLPRGIVSIGTSAFQSCTNLRKVTPLFPASLKKIDLAAFSHVPIEGDMVLSNPELTTLTGHNAHGVFHDAHFTSVDLSETSITDIGQNAFYNNTAMTNLVLPPTLQSVGQSAFHDCKALRTVSPLLPSTLKSIAIAAFPHSPIEGDLVLSNPELTSLPGHEHGIFRDSHLTSVDLRKSGITSIGSHNFRDSPTLERIWMPEGLTGVGESAFYGCSKLNAVYWQDIATLSLHNYAFHINALTTRHFIPSESTTWDAYLGASCNVQALTDGERTALLQKYPDTRRIVGKVKMPSGTQNFQYLCRWSIRPGTLMLLR